jgi:RimJ/RimL family protein N-acetyltransferase
VLPKRITTKDGNTITIRHARESDAAALIRLLDEVFAEEAFMVRASFNQTPEDERAFIRSVTPPSLFVVAEHRGALVGWLSLFRLKAEFCHHVAELGIGVRKDYRGVGVGMALMRTAQEWAKAVGFEKITLVVRASNAVARRLYEKCGFVYEGHRIRQVKYRGQYDDDYMMAWFVDAGP